MVVDTVGFHDKAWLDGDKGHPQTDALHVTERFQRVNIGRFMQPHDHLCNVFIAQITRSRPHCVSVSDCSLVSNGIESRTFEVDRMTSSKT
jgi:hypothetical protein